ncbi:MAG: response regulator transcription factor, partial [Chloroflexota bacterium]
MTDIRVAIVDDHSVIRQGMRSLLTEAGMNVVGEAADGDAAIALAAQLAPDVMLLDIRMKGRDGLSALPEIKAASPCTQVIVLTTYANPSYLTQAMQSGASGFLLKEADMDDIISAVQAASLTNSLIDRNLLNEALGSISNVTTSIPEHPPRDTVTLDLVEPISDREYDVLELLAKGLSNAQIAERLSIGVTTVKTHVKHILQKLNVNDRTQAALIAVR